MFETLGSHVSTLSFPLPLKLSHLLAISCMCLPALGSLCQFFFTYALPGYPAPNAPVNFASMLACIAIQ